MDSSKDPSIYDHEGGALAASYEGSGNDDGPARVAFPAGTVEFRAVRNRCAQACRRFNETPEDAAPAQRSNLWLDIVRPVRDRNIDGPTITHDEALSNPDKKGKAQTPFVKPPFHADYGLRLIIGGSTFINRGCMIMDTPVADIRIGNHCNIGPHCTLVGVSHETHPKARLEKGTSMGRHITIGDNVWLGANVTILDGVTIGDGAVIGAGSVVTRNIPPMALALGVPAKVVKYLDDSEPSEARETVTSLGSALAHNRGLSRQELELELHELERLAASPSMPRGPDLNHEREHPLRQHSERLRGLIWRSEVMAVVTLTAMAFALLHSLFFAGILLGGKTLPVINNRLQSQ